MQTLLPIQTADLDLEPMAGFRLQRLEVLNWGTFDQRPWTVDLKGGTALLTGANGSGKSTLVDALLTLLVPNLGRNYNQASTGVGKKKERNEKSYVQGAYGRTRSEESYGSKAKLLREKGKVSVLMAYFSDQVAQKEVTLAQVLWIDKGAVRKFFTIADEALKTEYFTNFTHIPDLKRHLKEYGVEVFEQFSQYAQSFRRRFGLQSSKALDLFNQTVSIKEIGGLNEFVREHMLEKADLQTTIEELQESYENLTISHNAIQKARKQLEALMPLTQETKKYTRIENEVAALQQSQAIAPAFFASKKLSLLTQELKTLGEELTQLRHQKAERDRLLETLRQQEKDLEFAIRQDTVGQRLQELSRDIALAQKLVTEKKGQSERYSQLATWLGLATYKDRDTFYAAKAKGEDLSKEIEAALQALKVQRDEQVLQANSLQRQQTQLSDELTSLRSRKSQIPKRSLDIRDRLVQDLNLNDADLPFVGELLRVRSEAKDWEGAIERLLRGFGLCLLVADEHYSAVSDYVNKTYLRGRLVYYRVVDTPPNPTQRALDPDRVPYRLKVKPDDERFSQWLRSRLRQQFNYVCCDTIDRFQRETKAITRNGLIKQGQGRHEKDDRSQVGDRTQYILGWDNTDKIKVLEADLKQLNRQLKEIEQRIQKIESAQGQRRQQTVWLQDFMRFADFTDIDWQTVERDRQDLQAQQQALAESSNQLKQLKNQLKTAQSDIAQAEATRDQTLRDIQTLENRQSAAQKECDRCEEKLRLAAPSDIEAFAKRMAAKLKAYAQTVESISQDESEFKDFLQQKLRQKEKQQSDSRSAIERCIAKFKGDFPEVTAEFGSTVEDRGDYLKLKAQIEKDDLPKHEKRFKLLMNEKVIITISVFKSILYKQEEEIQAAIDTLNDALQKIDYTDSTYIKLCYETTRFREIRDFRETLKDCLGDAAQQSTEDNEARFEVIRTRLIERFKAEERWTRLVTDVRNWLDFSVSERYRADDTEKEHHTDSSGKSGGQKVKLAYTILASAIAYQFGLNSDDGRTKSFRFVVIDEAFSKSDDSNACYAMELFKNLDLQLLVITPKDKINVIEPYIASLHFVSNTPEGDCSKIASISIEDYRQMRQESLSSK